MSLTIQLGLSFALVSRYGLVGFAVAQLAQQLFILAAGWLAFYAQLGIRPRSPFQARWSREVFRELVSYGFAAQASTILSSLFEPITKFAMSSLWGLAALGTFELAHRLVTQIRYVAVAPVQVLVPEFASSEMQPTRRRSDLFTDALALAGVGTALVIVGTVAASPIVSQVWFGRADWQFFAFVSLLALGWATNTYCSVAYVLGLSLGYLRWNILGHLTTALTAYALCYLLGDAMGPIGVVTGATVALALGSSLSAWKNCMYAGVPLFPKPADFRLAIFNIISTLQLGWAHIRMRLWLE
jgi:O-antigen/teichoic acid export membrane protein